MFERGALAAVHTLRALPTCWADTNWVQHNIGSRCVNSRRRVAQARAEYVALTQRHMSQQHKRAPSMPRQVRRAGASPKLGMRGLSALRRLEDDVGTACASEYADFAVAAKVRARQESGPCRGGVSGRARASSAPHVAIANPARCRPCRLNGPTQTRPGSLSDTSLVQHRHGWT